MITAMRKGATGWVAKILFVLLILSFGAWGIVDYLQPDPDPVVIRVGDTEVRQSWVRTRFGQALEQVRRRLGSTVTQELALDMGLDDQVIDGIIDQQVIGREASSLGLATNDSMLRSAIAQDPTFQGVTGGFDRARYQQILFQSGLSEGQFLQDLSGRLIRDPLLAAVALAPPQPEPIVLAQYGFFAEQRQITLVYKKHDEMTAPVDPGDTVLRTFYDAAEDDYQLPELRAISAIVLSPEQIAKGFAVPEERIAEEYENRRAQFHRPEERTVSQIVFQDAEQAANALKRLQVGESWVTVVGESGGTAAELGSRTKSGLVPAELAEPVFALTKSGFVGPLETAFGHHVLWVKAIDPAETQPLEAVREDLRQSIALDLAIDELIARANAVEDTLAGGDSLEAASDAAEVPIARFDAVSRIGQDASGKRVEGLAGSGQLLAVAYQLQDGETSILTEMPDGGYFVVRVDRINASAKNPFTDVRAQVLRDWQNAQKSDQALAEGDSLAETLRVGGDVAASAEAAGFATADLEPFARNAAPQPATPELVEAVFKARKGEIVVHNDFDRIFVARLDDVITPKTDESDETAKRALDQLRQILNRDRGQDLARAFQEAARARYDVEIDEAAIDRLLR